MPEFLHNPPGIPETFTWPVVLLPTFKVEIFKSLQDLNDAIQSDWEKEQ